MYGGIFQCLGPEKTLTDCTFEEATAQCADHRFDVAVRCSNNPPAEPIFGSLRIVNEMGTPALDGIGRLQVYRDGQQIYLLSFPAAAAAAAVCCC